MQPNDLAKSQQAVDRVGRGALLNAGDLMAAEASGPGYLTDAPLASCLARRFADLLNGHFTSNAPMDIPRFSPTPFNARLSPMPNT